MSVEREFASDNHSGAHPEVLEAIVAANAGHADSYGGDRWSGQLDGIFREHFGTGALAFPVFTGTAANVLCVEVLARPHEAVICTADAHINVDECGAAERIAGTKLLTVPGRQGKLGVEDVERWEGRRGDEHHVQPRIVSITQSTELGTVYRPEEIAAIAARAHELGMLVHMDGARIANAAASLELPFAAFTGEVGVDAVSFGGTKNGLLFGEVALFLGEVEEPRVRFARKQLMQLASKMRFLSVQFEALFADELWLRSARHANRMAALLGELTDELDGAEVVYPVEANAVFARLPKAATDALLDRLPGTHPFYVWDEREGIVRWMCSWDTTREDVEGLIAATERALDAA